MTVFDAIIYNGEADVLEIRLNELDEVVDRFIIVEAPYTHAGQAKELRWPAQRGRFARWHGRITYHVDFAMPIGSGDPWAMEFHQRDAAAAVLAEHALPLDLVLVSDVDEIPAAADIAKFTTGTGVVPVVFRPVLFYYRLDWRVPFEVYQFPFLDRWRRLRGRSLAQVRRNTASWPQAAVLHSGWHFSYLGDEDSICAKLRAIAEAGSVERYADPAWIRRCMANGQDFMGRFQCEAVDINDTWPRYVVDNPERWRSLCRAA